MQAAPFCYGPVSTTLNVIRHLVRYGHKMVMIDEGPTGELIRRSGLPVECVSFSTVPPFSSELIEAIKQADLVVSNTDPIFAAESLKYNPHTVVVDTLFWMWDDMDDSLLDCDLFIIQNFSNMEAQIERLGRPSQMVVTGPLMSMPENPIPFNERENMIHVSLGGCHCSLVDGACDPYPSMILSVIEEIGSTIPQGCRVVFTAGEQAVCALGGKKPIVEMMTLSNDENVALMRKARASLLSPGLTGAMEAFAAQTPVFFLPPQNYSQVLQLEQYRENGVAPHSFTWSDVYPDFRLPPYMPEEEAVNRVREIVGRFCSDTDAIAALKQRLKTFFTDDLPGYDPQQASRFFADMGGNGAEAAAAAIDRVLKPGG
jgi:hypothetical protein